MKCAHATFALLTLAATSYAFIIDQSQTLRGGLSVPSSGAFVKEPGASGRRIAWHDYGASVPSTTWLAPDRSAGRDIDYGASVPSATWLAPDRSAGRDIDAEILNCLATDVFVDRAGFKDTLFTDTSATRVGADFLVTTDAASLFPPLNATPSLGASSTSFAQLQLQPHASQPTLALALLLIPTLGALALVALTLTHRRRPAPAPKH